MIKFKSQSGDTFLSTAETKLKHTVNGEKSLTGTIYSNEDVLNNIDRGWSLEFEDEKYYVTYAAKNDLGNGIAVDFDAVHEFFFKMAKTSIYEELSDGSHTAKTYLDFIFNGSEYSYNLAVNVTAFEKQSFGMNTRLSLFNDFINQTELEFSVTGKTVTIVQQNGQDLSTIVRKGFNLNELGLELNIGDFVTYGRGFGVYNDEEDHSKGRLEVEYTSPLASVYGKLEAAPFADERYTISSNLLNKVKSIVDNSYTISVNLSMEDLQRAGYEYAVPVPGDYIMAVDETLGFQQRIRIVGVNVSYNIDGESVKTEVTCSSISSADQYNNADAKISDTMSGIIDGTKVIPNSWLTDAVQTATESLLNTQTELRYTSNGLIAIDKTNANNVVIFNSAGIGVSNDGGKTFANAITGKGINATAITAGILKAINVEGVNISGSTIDGGLINGATFRTTSATDTNTYIELMQGLMTFNSGGNIYGEIAPSAGTGGSDSGVAIIQIPGRALSFNSSYGNGTSQPAFRIPPESTGSNPLLEINGRLNSDISSNKNVMWIKAKQQVIISGNDGGGNQLNIYGNHVDVLGNFTVYNGSKNAAHVTRDGVRATPAYETAESYLGDIGESQTDDTKSVKIEIETLFNDIVNTAIDYQVFITSYDSGHIWVSDRQDGYFIVKSDNANAKFGWEIKAKRRGYENERLVLQEMNNQTIDRIFSQDNQQGD